MRVSTSKSEAMVLDRKKVACTLQVGGEVLPQVEEFKYLGVLFTSEGRMDREIDRRIGAAAAVMWSMYWSVVVKKELSRKAKLSIYQSIYVPTLTYGHELWVMTERVRSRIQTAEMSFLRRVAGRSLRDRVRSSVTREELGVEPLLLHIERGQLRWLGHLFRMPPGCLPGEVFRACPTGKRPRGRPRTRWRDYVFRLAWERLGVPPEELEEVARESEVCSPHVQQECEGFNYLHGVCVELNVSLTYTHIHKPVFQECHEIPPLDAVILFDDSQSISEEDFKKMINFIKDVIRLFTNPRAQVAVAKFSSGVSAIFHFENFAVVRNADSLMSGITHSKGNTYTPSAIRFVLKEMFQEKVGMRNNSQKLLIVITDGQSNDKNDNFSSVIALANKRGVTRFAIGVGKEYSREELEQIATEPRYVFESPSFSSLSTIVTQLTERIFSIE
ncbi:hypothetical protein QTP86_026892, partial [Hemibagrus guttatus]